MTPNLNHSHDRDLLERLDDLLERGVPTGDELLDNLAQTIPQADRAYRDALEASLLTRLSATKKTERIPKRMTALTLDHPIRVLPHRRIPVTLAAAVFAVVLAGLVLFAMNGSRPPAETNLAAPLLNPDEQQEPTALPPMTASPVPLTPNAGTVSAEQAETLDGVQQLTATPVVAEVQPVLPTSTPLGGSEQTIFATSVVPMGCFPPSNQTAMVHLVVMGETLFDIAQRYGVDPEHLRVFNCLSDSNPLVEGMWLMIPVDPNGVQVLTPTLIPFGVPADLVPVVVARVDIPAGVQIMPEMLIVTYWPASDAPRLTANAIEDVTGLYATTQIPRYMPVILSGLTEDGEAVMTSPTPPPILTATPASLSDASATPRTTATPAPLRETSASPQPTATPAGG